MRQLSDICQNAIKPAATVAKHSARHPIHVILTVLFLSSFAYLSIIQSYLIEWEMVFKNKINTYEFEKLHLMDGATHYYHSSSSSDAGKWNVILDSEIDKITFSEHYYLYTFTFLDEFGNASNDCLPEIPNVFHESPGSKYVLSKELNLPRIFSDEHNVNWHLSSTKDYFTELKHRILFVMRDIMSSNHLEQTDLSIIGGSYIILLYTFFLLFNDMREVGSNFWLGISTVTNSICALFLALYTMKYFIKTTVPILNLLEGLPYFVVIMGFRNKVTLSAYVLKRFGIINISKTFTSDNVIYEAFSNEGIRLLKDYLLGGLICAGCMICLPNFESLVSLSLLTVLILFYDFLLTITFYSAILCLKVDINTIHRTTLIRETLEEEGVVAPIELLNSSKGISTKSYFKSNTAISIAKVFAFLVLVVLNLYTINFNVVINSIKSIYSAKPQANFPEFILTKNYSRILSKNILISVMPPRYYQKQVLSNPAENVTIMFLRFIGTAIQDKFISKVIFIALIFSISTNVYLLNTAKVHTRYTVTQLYTNAKNKKEDVSKKMSKLTKIDSITTKARYESPTFSLPSSSDEDISDTSTLPFERTLEETEQMMKEGLLTTLHDNEIADLVITKKLPLYSLEKELHDTERAVVIRRKVISITAKAPILESEGLPYRNYDYDRVIGACCENVIGYVPLPVGVIGPLVIDNVSYHIPMATTEGCLVASAMRGCKAINAGGGTITVLTRDGMTRGPCVRFPSLIRAGACKLWLDSIEGSNLMKNAFNSTSRFAKLQHIQTTMAGDLLFIRFRTTTGDAMGMNMISKGVEYSLKQMVEEFGWSDMEIVSLSGNYCTDKKSAAINWINGRGKSVVAEATIPSNIVKRVLKCDVKPLVELNISKNLVGSAVAGSLGGFNAHASNIVTALFLAIGQDPAQNIESSNCITIMKETKEGHLNVSVSMPSIEVGTIGGGTILRPQSTMLDLLGVRGPHPIHPGENARQLAKIVASAVLAGELSLCAALASGHLVQSHMKHNRTKDNRMVDSPLSDVNRSKDDIASR
ncbi:hypothetical protein KAFR_0E04250 [Kazachstania africana CBS 2517]|uniref:3-hydroxy-3-methylglutaryl coenzyme A reductase n=1 Tax=Kazachstania africana (strain ATCC 22294 / BCRC 22015 / CBS 2517 / CECT 1963 / NBRC 1671 / NRRL Y-8276) TaxID=1071382 RepID=H2AW26_KAZAF|nr:hypothetical protein KAFR_0E04250 [Kazachstania africana CBS 2517]CCF58576.1 hypothetical protein KAFR_0E04250 [Kazachstania africana CBS 2517]